MSISSGSAKIARLFRFALLIGLCELIVGACASPKFVMPPLGFRTTITVRDDAKNQIRMITDPAVVQRVHTLISALTAQKGRTVITTPAASRQVIVIETSNANSLRLDLWPDALSNSRTTWTIDESFAITLFELLGLEKPSRW